MFSKRSMLMRRNTVRDFLKYSDRREMISFAGGLPGPEVFPVDAVRSACENVLITQGTRALQYGASEGIEELRSHLAHRYSNCGVLPRNVMITTGSMQALDLLGRVILDEGDLVYVENPTYLAILAAWRTWGIRFRGMFSDADGFDLTQTDSAEVVKALYCIPNFQNPSGVTLSQSRRRDAIRWASAHGTVIVEDDPYGELRYEGPSIPSLMDLSGTIEGPVVHVGSFSKVLAPGFRLGWIIAPDALMEKLVLAKQSADLHTSTLSQFIVWELIQQGIMEQQLESIRRIYREKRDEMLMCLSEEMPSGVVWTRPAGGMFLLATLPDEICVDSVIRETMALGVAVVPGREFHVQGGSNTIRLNFSYPSKRQIREGITKLGSVIRGCAAVKVKSDD